MQRFLRELERCLAGLSPAQRADVGKAYLALIKGVEASTKVIGGFFRPSLFASLELLGALSKAMKPGGGERLVADLKKNAPKVGPHVAALVSAL